MGASNVVSLAAPEVRAAGLLAGAAGRLRGRSSTSTTSTRTGRSISFPRSIGRPKRGHKAGTSAAPTRSSSSDPRRRRAPKAPVATPPIAADALLVSVRQAAVVLGVGVSTIWAWIGTGRLQPVDLGLRRVLLRRVDVERLAASLESVVAAPGAIPEGLEPRRSDVAHRPLGTAS